MISAGGSSMEKLLKDIIANFHSKTFRNYYLENPPSWDFHQMIKVIMTYAKSKQDAASLYRRYSELLSDPLEKQLCLMMAKDMQDSGSFREETIEFSRKIPFREMDIAYINMQCLISLNEPVFFSELDVVEYILPEMYGNTPQIGILIKLFSGLRILASYYEIWNLSDPYLPDKKLRREIVPPFDVDKVDVRTLDKEFVCKIDQLIEDLRP